MQQPSCPRRAAIVAALIDVEWELRNLGLWSAQRPSDTALSSTQPFAIDTLRFEQWLQFIYLPTLHTLIAQEEALPTACGVAPMIEEVYRGRGLALGQLKAALAEVDRLITPS
jgi:uncharacterized protein YqcC (DUF446 family)